MVIRLVTHRHTLLLQSAATLLVDLHSCIDGRLGGILTENTTHLMEHPKDRGSRRCAGEVLLMVNEILRVGVALSRRLYKIAQSFLTVCLHLLPQQIELSQRVLGKLIALGSRVLQKFNGGNCIPRHPLRAGEQQLAEPVLRVWIVLLRCLPQPVKGLRELLLLQQQFAQRICRARISGLRRFLKPLCRRFSVNRYAKPVLICLSQLVCRAGIALLLQTVECDQCH